MKKMQLLFSSLLVIFIGVIVLPCSVLAELSNEKVEVVINTRQKEGQKVQGTDNLNFTIYNLTNWRHSNVMSEKEAKEFLLDKNATKEEMQNFIRTEGLEPLSEEMLPVNSEGEARTILPRYQDSKDAAYLILANGETGKFRFLPIVLFFPQYYVDSKMEAFKVMIYGKYAEEKEPSVSTPTTGTVERPAVPNIPMNTSQKSLPQTNDLLNRYSVLGGLIFILAIMGLKRTQKYRGEKL
ncbi:pilin N-terminal domain-containing protein [Enterococcus sp.]|uniref:pilin N-terminal domain-containing protein n=1 Tax=Enterococcus sp. TaxID=35783 RepID=UPI00290BD11A|nr:pilin N-terminal domain-containing protein [Enterococcus sp.]MDU5336207.1 hypothetical protein [Enterococcus sp.]